ncbi:MAG: coproporphyrinogen oxidase [Bacteriovoracaceae bacterium]|nr:coproporphyrinogen oxidase [Bacteriovoracaceae bacterium]
MEFSLADAALSSSVYVHYPICQHHCSYCDFNVSSRVSSPAGFDESWLLALERQFSAVCSPKKKKIKTFYLGGGTPSLLTLESQKRLINIFNSRYLFSGETEFTIECNPEHLTKEHLVGLKEVGVNRVSLGIQTTLPKQLKRLERLATAGKIHKTVKWISEEFSNFSLDLMIGIPDQTLETLEEDLNFIKEVSPPHVSIYILTLDDHHKWRTRPAIRSRLADSELAAKMYEKVCEFMRSEGYCHYEVSNFSKPGFESQHNSNYWNVDSDYFGFGPGAHGYLKMNDGRRIRYETERDLKLWSNSTNGISSFETLSSEQKNLERLYLSLRTRKPISIHDCQPKKLESLREGGLIVVENDAVLLTDKGWVLMEAIASELLF